MLASAALKNYFDTSEFKSINIQNSEFKSSNVQSVDKKSQTIFPKNTSLEPYKLFSDEKLNDCELEKRTIEYLGGNKELAEKVKTLEGSWQEAFNALRLFQVAIEIIRLSVSVPKDKNFFLENGPKQYLGQKKNSLSIQLGENFGVNTPFGRIDLLDAINHINCKALVLEPLVSPHVYKVTRWQNERLPSSDEYKGNLASEELVKQIWANFTWKIRY